MTDSIKQIVAGVLLAVTCSLTQARTENELPAPKASQPFALVELFTSEGCSSCPPADKVLRELKDAAVAGARRVFTLSYHVDYWDRLGWKDPYSDAIHTYRQRLYGKAFNSNRIYTPQMIVNGRTGFVGSDRPVAEETIEKALEVEPDFGIAFEVAAGDTEQDRLLRYRLSGVPSEEAVVIAVIAESGLSTDVQAGENDGRMLKHDSVARAMVFERVESDTGDLMFRLPENVNIEQASVVLFLQDVATMQILAAEKQPLAEIKPESPEQAD